MGVFRQFPYSNFHEMNLDEIIKIVKNMLEEWAQYYDTWDDWKTQVTREWEEMKSFINNYFDNLDVQTEINNKINTMVSSGEFEDIVSPYIPPEVTAWLAEHITTPETVVIDDSLTIEGAAADAKATGDGIRSLSSKIDNISTPSINLYNYLTRTDSTGISSTGVITTSATYENYSVSDWIEVEAGKTLYFSVNSVTWGARRLNAYNASKELLAGSPIENPTTYTVPEGVKYIRFSGITEDRMNSEGTQLQYGGITPYVPYANRLIKKSAYSAEFVELNTTRYVSNSGSDDNNGLTALTPFKTFAKAIADGAETLFIEADEYTERIVPQTGKPLKIRPYNGEEIILTDNGTTNYLIYAQFSDIDIEGVTCQGALRYGFILQACTGILKNCKASYNDQQGFCLDGSNINLYDCEADHNGIDGFNAHTFTHSSIDYNGKCNFFNCIADNNGDDGLSFHETNDFSVYGGEYTNNAQGGIVPYGECIAEVYNALISGNGQGLYGLASSASSRQKIKSFGNLIKSNTTGIVADYYKITSINDVLSDNSTNTVERHTGEITIY